MIPAFDANGNLPPGIHLATVNEIRKRFAHNSKRQRLFEGLLKILTLLRSCECKEIYLNGSFITDEPFPNDYDLCWDSAGVVPTRELKSFLEQKRIRKSKYLGDIFVRLPQPPFYFDHVVEWQKDRDGKAKGLIKILLEDNHD